MMHIVRSARPQVSASLSFLLLVTLPMIAANTGCMSRSFHITETYTFRAKQQANEVSLGVILPKSGPYQRVANLQVCWDGPVEMEDRSCVQVARLTGKVEPGKPTEATISYDVVLSRAVDKQEAPLPPKYTQPEPNVESDQPAIVEKARQLARSGDPRRDARAIHAFVKGHLKQPRGSWQGGSPSAWKALETGMGVCEQTANLTVALCRAAGIPARTMQGLTMNSPFWNGTSCSHTWNHPGIAHAWAEVRTQTGWEPMGMSYFLLCYGEGRDMQEVWEELYLPAEAKGRVISAMSNPLQYVAAASPGVTVVPAAKVEKRWSSQ